MTEGKRWLVVSILVILVISQTVTGYCLVRTNQRLNNQYFALDRALSTQQASTSQEFRDVERSIEGLDQRIDTEAYCMKQSMRKDMKDLEQSLAIRVRSAEDNTRVHMDSELDRHYTKVELEFKLRELEERLMDWVREYRR